MKMKLTQSTLERNFTVKHKGKTYYVGFLDSDGYISGFVQPGWEVLDEEFEELSICASNTKLYKKLSNSASNTLMITSLILRIVEKPPKQIFIV